MWRVHTQLYNALHLRFFFFVKWMKKSFWAADVWCVACLSRSDQNICYKTLFMLRIFFKLWDLNSQQTYKVYLKNAERRTILSATEEKRLISAPRLEKEIMRSATRVHSPFTTKSTDERPTKRLCSSFIITKCFFHSPFHTPPSSLYLVDGTTTNMYTVHSYALRAGA